MVASEQPADCRACGGPGAVPWVAWDCVFQRVVVGKVRELERRAGTRTCPWEQSLVSHVLGLAGQIKFEQRRASTEEEISRNFG